MTELEERVRAMITKCEQRAAEELASFKSTNEIEHLARYGVYFEMALHLGDCVEAPTRAESSGPVGRGEDD